MPAKLIPIDDYSAHARRILNVAKVVRIDVRHTPEWKERTIDMIKELSAQLLTPEERRDR